MDKRIENNQRGFTLIELLVVLLILGLLAGIVGPSLFDEGDRAKVKQARLQIANLSSALEMFKLDTGKFPTTEQGLQALITPPSGAKNFKKGGYLKKKVIPKDPWDNAYNYVYPGNHDAFDISSYGEDGAPGGEELNKDINSWEL